MAWIFGRPEYDISFHVNTDSADLIGTDTFINNEVRLRKGSIYQCAEFGGFGILDEINMAKNDAVSVLHATLDHRRRIDIPGYNRILLHSATRFIGTMNYGYAGTRELNEALVSRFMVIDMPEMDEDSVLFILRQHFPDGEKSALKAFAGLFLDLQIKAYHGEISTKSLDLRGLVSAVKATRSGLSPIDAIQMGIINKSFDVFEKEIVEDVVSTRIPSSWTGKDIWGETCMEDVRWPAEQLEEHHLEISNRIRNLFWTVSGDYDTEFEPDTEKYVYSKQTVLYEAVKQGAFARYFDQKKLGMYLMKKLHFSAGEDMLLPLQRFRNYEEPRETNERIFQFRAYANNRDGLALKTVGSSLMERPEKNKILIVLSDGKPCDMSIQRPGTRQPKIYDGEKAVKDTAYEVRWARNQGIFVIGIFVGNEEELSVEKRIYGKDFAYIRNISNFSRIVGTFLRRQIDME